MTTNRHRTDRRWLPPRLGALAAAGLVASAASCNERRLVPLRELVDGREVQEIAIPERPKLDLLWVIDSSASMCEEQAHLARSFGAMADKLREIEADINVAVVTTDMEDVTQQGRLQRTPATVDHASCSRPCLEDAQCGGGCLCGVPHIRRCEADHDCEGDERCVAAPGGSIRHCASPCTSTGLAHEPHSDRCGAAAREQQILTCRSVPAAGGSYCTLTPCAGDADCNAGKDQRCLPGPDGLSTCRWLRRSGTRCRVGVRSDCPLGVECVDQGDGTGLCEPTAQCPPATCDCPARLPSVLSSADPDFEHSFGCLATVGTRGDALEKGLEAMRKALDPRMTASGGPNEGFLRQDAYLGVVVLSDEDDCSDDGHPCEPGQERCTVCLPSGECRGESEDEGMRCVADSLDLDADGEPVHYCRLPRRDASECERARDYLRPVGQYVELLRRTKDDPTRAERMTGPPCEEDADCEDGRICSRRAGRCIEDKVVVAAIVGPDAEGDPARPSCTGATGQAFDGRRYAGLVDASSAQGVRESICGDQADFRRALEEIGEMVVDAVEPSLCLPHPLVPCRSDADCGEGYACHGLSTAAERRGAGWSPTPYCADADGLPETLRVLIAEARQEGEEEGAPWPRTLREPAYTFVPGDGPHGFGCFRFISDGPGPGEQVRLSYRPKLVSE